MVAEVSPKLLDRPAHLLFHASHAQSRLFRDFGVTIAIKAASEKYLPGQRLEAQDGLFDTGKTVARLQRSDRIPASNFDIVYRHMLGLVITGNGAGVIAQEIVRGLAQIGSGRMDRDGIGLRAGNEPGEDLLDDLLGAIVRSATIEEAQEPWPLSSVQFVDGRRHRCHAIMRRRQRLAFVDRQTGRS